jgi:hypothetical protein
MADDNDRERGVPEPADLEDQLSPSRALRESAARAGGQRIGNNGPVANPEVSYPAEPPDSDEPEAS